MYKRQGVECVWHSDGNLMPLMNGILDSGIDGLHCIDPFAGMDAARLWTRLRVG